MAVLIEVVLTAIVALVVLFPTHKASPLKAQSVPIRFALAIVHLIGIPLTGTSVNSNDVEFLACRHRFDLHLELWKGQPGNSQEG